MTITWPTPDPLDINYDKDVDINVDSTINLTFDGDVDFTKDVCIDIHANSYVDADGFFAQANFDVESTGGDGGVAEIDLVVLTTDDMAMVQGSATSFHG